MLRIRYVLRPRDSALDGTLALQQDYMRYCLELDKRFDPSRA
jgi:hypothetical protein